VVINVGNGESVDGVVRVGDMEIVESAAENEESGDTGSLSLVMVLEMIMVNGLGYVVVVRLKERS
jgi:hypothetical protein